MASLSVVLPNYNHKKYLPYALEAILTQTFSAQEILVIDDASSDGSHNLINQYANTYPQLKLLQNDKNIGPVKCMLKGLKIATGEYIYFASADDLILPELFEKSIGLLSDHPQAGFCSSYVNEFNGDCKNIRKKIVQIPMVLKNAGYIPPEKAYHIIYKYGPWFIGTSTVYRRQSLLDARGFCSELYGYSDNFACTNIALSSGCCFIPNVLACWRRGERGYASNMLSDINRSTKIIYSINMFVKESDIDYFDDNILERINKRLVYSILISMLYADKLSQQSLNVLLPLSSNYFRNYIFLLSRIYKIGKPAATLNLLLLLRHYDIVSSICRRIKYKYIEFLKNN